MDKSWYPPLNTHIHIYRHTSLPSTSSNRSYSWSQFESRLKFGLLWSLTESAVISLWPPIPSLCYRGVTGLGWCCRWLLHGTPKSQAWRLGPGIEKSTPSLAISIDGNWGFTFHHCPRRVGWRSCQLSPWHSGLLGLNSAALTFQGGRSPSIWGILGAICLEVQESQTTTWAWDIRPTGVQSHQVKSQPGQYPPMAFAGQEHTRWAGQQLCFLTVMTLASSFTSFSTHILSCKEGRQSHAFTFQNIQQNTWWVLERQSRV